MHVWMILISLHILPKEEFPPYIQPCNKMQQMQMHERQMLKNQTQSIKPNSLKTLQNFSPIGTNCRNGWKELEGQYSENFSIRCAYLKIWVLNNAHIQWRILGENQTILRIKRLQKKNTNWKIWECIHKGRKQSKRSKESIGQKRYQFKHKMPIETRDTNWNKRYQ